MAYSLFQILTHVFVLCPVPYVYVYLHLTQPPPEGDNRYDVYYTLHGREQDFDDATRNCTRCISSWNNPNRSIVNASCVGADYHCSVQLALQSIFRAFDYVNYNPDPPPMRTRTPSEFDDHNDDTAQTSHTPTFPPRHQ